MRSAYAWALVVAVLATSVDGAGHAVGAVLAVLLLCAGDREERRERLGFGGPGSAS